MNTGADSFALRDRYCATAFGLEFECEWPLPGTHQVFGETASPSPRTLIREVDPEVAVSVRRKPSKQIHEALLADGTTWFRVNRTDDGYEFWVKGYGRYWIAEDGGLIECERGSATRRQQERFVMSHGLPMAAVLNGFEVLHGSAVARRSAAAAFVGASGMGKTTIASRLIVRGADLISDDVLALAPSDEGPIAHPGPPFMAIQRQELALVTDTGARLGASIGTTDKAHVSPITSGVPVPLRVLYHLEVGSELEILPLEDRSPRRTLGLSFLPFVVTPERLSRHLRIAHLISADVAQFRLRSPRTVGVEERLVDLVDAHMRAQGV